MIGIGFGGVISGDRSIVNVKRKGALGDGVTDDTAAIQAALSTGENVFLPKGVYYYTGTLTLTDNQAFFGEGRSSVLYPVTPSVVPIDATGDNVTIQDLAIIGDSPAGISVQGDNFTIKNVHFETNGTKLSQCVRIFTANNVKVLNCSFEDTGYGIIQAAGYVSDNVLIHGNFANNMRNDMIEANCTNSAPSKNWIITNNIFQNGKNYAAAITAEAGADYVTYKENRFIGITAVSNVIIADNIAENVAGDSAVHVEDVGTSLVISGNMFDNILGLGYINISQTLTTTDYNECIITGNTFRRTDNSSEIGNVLVLSSNRYVNEVLFTNNRIIGDSSKNLTFDIGFQNKFKILNNTFRYCTSAIDAEQPKFGVIRGNAFRNCDTAILGLGMQNMEILDNVVSDCTKGFDFGDGTLLQSGAKDVKISGNVFSNIAGYNLITRRDSNGDNPPTRVTVSNNVFCANGGATTYAVRITGNAPTGATATQNCSLTENTFLTGATVDMTGDNFTRRNNIYHDGGAEDFVVDGDTLRISTQATPASASATGTKGDIVHDTNYIYICTATNTWKRSAIATW